MTTLTNTHWAGTLHLNAVRIISATITLAVLYILGRLAGILSGPSWANLSLLNVLIMPALLLPIGLGVIVVFRILGSMSVPFTDAAAGLASLMMIAFIAVGDPLIWFARKYHPTIVPVEQFNFINPHAVMMVQK